MSITLEGIVKSLVPETLARGRDYEGSNRCWVDLANAVLRDLENKGKFSLDQEKDVAVVPVGAVITLPTDFIYAKRLFDPVTLIDYTETPIVTGKMYVYDECYDADNAPAALTLRYVGKFTVLTKLDDLAPLDTKFYNAFAAGLCSWALTVGDTNYASYLTLYNNEISNLDLSTTVQPKENMSLPVRVLPGMDSLMED